MMIDKGMQDVERSAPAGTEGGRRPTGVPAAAGARKFSARRRAGLDLMEWSAPLSPIRRSLKAPSGDGLPRPTSETFSSKSPPVQRTVLTDSVGYRSCKPRRTVLFDRQYLASEGQTRSAGREGRHQT